MKYPPDDPKLTAYALGELDAGETAAVAAAVENSDECRSAVGETRETASLLASALQTETCPELSAAQRAAIEMALATASKTPAKNEARRGQTSFLLVVLAWRPRFATVVLWATACLIAVVGWGLWAEVFCNTGRDGSQRGKEIAIRLNPKPATPSAKANQSAKPTAVLSPAFSTPVLTNGAGVLMATFGIGGGNGYTNFSGYVGTPFVLGGTNVARLYVMGGVGSLDTADSSIGTLTYSGNLSSWRTGVCSGSWEFSTYNDSSGIGVNGPAFIKPAGDSYRIGGGGGTAVPLVQITTSGANATTVNPPGSVCINGRAVQVSQPEDYAFNGHIDLNGNDTSLLVAAPVAIFGCGTLPLGPNNTYLGTPLVQISGGSGPGATAIAQANSTAPPGNAARVVHWNTFNGGFDVNGNNYSGGSILDGGYLFLGSTKPSGIAGNSSITPPSGAYNLGANTLTLNGNNRDYFGGTILAAGNISYSGPTLVSQGTLVFAGGLLQIAASTMTNIGYAVSTPDTESYAPIRDNPFLAVVEHPLSTFSIDVDTASYSNVRRFLLQGRLPPPNAVRIEEMINYFTYDYAKPKSGEPFSVNVETAACPWAGDHRLVRIGLKGREVTAAKRPPCNLVFLIDVSGSMGEANKLSLIKPAMRLLVEQLTENERVAIVVFNDTARVVLASTSGDRKQEILDAMESLKAGGCTNGGDGLRLAYDVATRNFIEHGVNRVILCTDGDFNAGNIVNLPDLTRLIERERQTGVFLTALGFGMGNLKDATLERLADKGNGHYAYIDTFFEARKVLVEQVNGTLVTIAKDVKIQVEFNPAKVAGYRLIGYEDRLLRKEDFNNDRKDAGEIGAGHTVTALYEIVPAGQELPSPPVDPLKYQPAPKPVAPVSGSNDLLTVKLRYKQPDGDKSALIEQAVTDSGKGYAAASRDFKFASAVAAFGMVLRDSPHKGNASLAAVLELAEESRGPDVSGYRTEFLSLVKKAQALGKR